MKFRCSIGLHKYIDVETSRTKNIYYGYGYGLPGLRIKQVCLFCSKERYVKLNIAMPTSDLYKEHLWEITSLEAERELTSEIDKLVTKIFRGESVISKEELQFYLNNSEEIERRLRKGAREA